MTATLLKYFTKIINDDAFFPIMVMKTADRNESEQLAVLSYISG